MADATHPKEGFVGAMSVMTVALYRRASTPDSIGQAVRYACPSEAVRAAVASVTKEPGDLSAIVLTAESSDADSLFSRFRGGLWSLQPGQVAVTLATQELSRSGLDDSFRFELFGNVDANFEGTQDRLFLVAHEGLKRTPSPEPVQLAPRGGFIGRGAEIAEIRRKLDLVRLVTVLGAPGIGKSALIRRLADEAADDFPGRIIHADLTSIGQSEVVVPFLLRLTGAIRLPGESALDALIAYLRDRHCLLIIDNADSVMAEVRRLVSLILRETEGLSVLVGSSRATKIPGEARVKLEGLEFPVTEINWVSIAEYDSVVLFVDRAQLVDSKFRLTQDNASAIGRLCQRLDGIPLAIELAAAKVSILSPRQILDRLDDRFLLLQDQSPGRADRHRTLRATVEWSYQQLRKDSKILLQRLALFEGAFSFEDASMVAIDGEVLRHDDLYSAFDELAESSMITTSSIEGREKRFFMLETVRLFAIERLRSSGEESEIIGRYRGWVLSVDRAASEGLNGNSQLDWLCRIDAGYEDIRRLIESCSTVSGDIGAAMQQLLSIHPYYFHRNYFAEGLRMAERILGHRRASAQPQYAKVLNFAAALSLRASDIRKARTYALKSLSTALQQNDLSGIGAARSTLGTCALEMGRLGRACRHYRSALTLFKSIRDPRLVQCLVNLVAVETDAGQYSTAHQHAVEAADLLEDHNNPVLSAYLNMNRGALAFSEGQLWISLTYIEWAVEHFVESGDHVALASSLRVAAFASENLGRLALAAYFLGAAGSAELKDFSDSVSHRDQKLPDLIQRLQESLGSDYFNNSIAGKMATRAEILQAIRSRTSI